MMGGGQAGAQALPGITRGRGDTEVVFTREGKGRELTLKTQAGGEEIAVKPGSCPPAQGQLLQGLQPQLEKKSKS